MFGTILQQAYKRFNLYVNKRRSPDPLLLKPKLGAKEYPIGPESYKVELNMETRFQECLSVILKHEGGYVNHPEDPGGETNLGVTKRVYEEFGGDKAMRDLVQSDVEYIYKKGYWDKCKCDNLPRGLDVCVFDFAVNAGPNRSAKYLQSAVGATSDGYIGPATIAAVHDYINRLSVKELIEKFQRARQRYYESLSTFETFGNGWTRRVNETTEIAKEMI